MHQCGTESCCGGEGDKNKYSKMLSKDVYSQCFSFPHPECATVESSEPTGSAVFSFKQLDAVSGVKSNFQRYSNMSRGELFPGLKVHFFNLINAEIEIRNNAYISQVCVLVLVTCHSFTCQCSTVGLSTLINFDTHMAI